MGSEVPYSTFEPTGYELERVRSALRYFSDREPFLRLILKEEMEVAYTRDVANAIVGTTVFVNPDVSKSYSGWQRLFEIESFFRDAVLQLITDESGAPTRDLCFELSANVMGANGYGQMSAVFDVARVDRSNSNGDYRFEVELMHGDGIWVPPRWYGKHVYYYKDYGSFVDATATPFEALLERRQTYSNGRTFDTAVAEGDMTPRFKEWWCEHQEDHATYGEAIEAFNRAVEQHDLAALKVGRHQGFDIYRNEHGYLWDKGGPSSTIAEIRLEIGEYHFQVRRDRVRRQLAEGKGGTSKS